MDFETVIKENQAMVFSIAVRFLRDRELAEEMAQDVFLQIHRRLQSLAGPEHATNWLRRAICHRCLDEMRRRKAHLAVALDETAELASNDASPDTLLNERLRRVVAALPEAARMVVILRYQEDLDPADIAKVLDMPIGTVKSQLHRSLGMLRERLEPRLERKEVRR